MTEMGMAATFISDGMEMIGEQGDSDSGLVFRNE